jgi:hypothetical protein
MFPNGAVYITEADGWELYNYSVLALVRDDEVFTLFGTGQWTQVYEITDDAIAALRKTEDKK